MSKRPGDTMHRREWCQHCDDMTAQTSRVLKPVPGTRLCATEWVCTPCGGYAV